MMKNMENNAIELNYEYLKIYGKNGIVIIHNIQNKKYVKITKEIFSYFKIASDCRMEIDSFLKSFKNEEDRVYMNKITNIMYRSNIIKNSEYELNDVGIDIHFCITNKCNLRCRHCFMSCENELAGEVTKNDICRMIDNISELPVNNLVISGGEPLIREDFHEIVSYLTEKNMCKSVHLSTNGTLIDGTNVEFIKENFDIVDISIDGVDEKTCSKIRGIGVFDKVINSVNLLKNFNFSEITLSMIIDKKNLDLYEEFIHLNDTLDTKPIVRHFIPKGRGKDNSYILTDSDTVLPLSIPVSLGESIRKGDFFRYTPFGCNAGVGQIFINYNGDIYPCPSMIKDEYLMGNILDYRFVDLYKNNKITSTDSYKKIEKLFPYNIDGCKDCDVSLFCLKCPSNVDIIKDDDILKKEWCVAMKDNVRRLVWRI